MLKLYYIDLGWEGFALCFAHNKKEAKMKFKDEFVSYESLTDEQIERCQEKRIDESFVYRALGDS